MRLAQAVVHTNTLRDGSRASNLDMIGQRYLIDLDSVCLKSVINTSTGKQMNIRAVVGRARFGQPGYVPLEILDIDEGTYEAAAAQETTA